MEVIAEHLLRFCTENWSVSTLHKATPYSKADLW